MFSVTVDGYSDIAQRHRSSRQQAIQLNTFLITKKPDLWAQKGTVKAVILFPRFDVAHITSNVAPQLKADVSENGPGWSDERIADALETSLSTVFRTRRQFVEEGLDAALSRKKSSWSPPWMLIGIQR